MNLLDLVSEHNKEDVIALWLAHPHRKTSVDGDIQHYHLLDDLHYIIITISSLADNIAVALLTINSNRLMRKEQYPVPLLGAESNRYIEYASRNKFVDQSCLYYVSRIELIAYLSFIYDYNSQLFLDRIQQIKEEKK